MCQGHVDSACGETYRKNFCFFSDSLLFMEINAHFQRLQKPLTSPVLKNHDLKETEAGLQPFSTQAEVPPYVDQPF